MVDDGSAEPAWRVVEAYSWIDPRIRVTRQKHAGVCTARNTGIAAARGEFLVFLDADDWLEPQALAELLGRCRLDGFGAAYGGLVYCAPDGTPTQWKGGYGGTAPLFEALCGSNVLSVPSSVMVRRSTLDEIGWFDPALAHCGDWDLWLRLARHELAVARIEDVVSGYRMRPGSLSRNPAALFRDAMTVLRQAHGPDERVVRADPRFAGGADREQLAGRIANFGVYAAGLAASSGRWEGVERVLEMVPRWQRLDAERAGEFLFYAICFANCRGPESVEEFWPGIGRMVVRLLRDLERRTGSPGFADETFQFMNASADGRLGSLTGPQDEVIEDRPLSPHPASASGDTLAYSTLLKLAAGQKR